MMKSDVDHWVRNKSMLDEMQSGLDRWEVRGDVIVMVNKFYNKDEYIKMFIILSTPFLIFFFFLTQFLCQAICTQWTPKGPK